MRGVDAQARAPVRVVPSSESPARSGRLPHCGPTLLLLWPMFSHRPSPLLPQVSPQNHSSVTLLHKKLRPGGWKQPVPVGLVSLVRGWPGRRGAQQTPAVSHCTCHKSHLYGGQPCRLDLPEDGRDQGSSASQGGFLERVTPSTVSLTVTSTYEDRSHRMLNLYKSGLKCRLLRKVSPNLPLRIPGSPSACRSPFPPCLLAPVV